MKRCPGLSDSERAAEYGCRGHEAAGEDCEWCRAPEDWHAVVGPTAGPTEEPATEPRARFRWAVREIANFAAELGVSVEVKDWYSDGRAYRHATFEMHLPSDGWATIICAVESLRRRIGAYYIVYRDGGLVFALSRDLTEEEQLVPWPSDPVPVRLSDVLGDGQ